MNFDDLKAKIEEIKLNIKLEESQRAKNLEKLKNYDIKSIDHAQKRIDSLNDEIKRLKQLEQKVLVEANKILDEIDG